MADEESNVADSCEAVPSIEAVVEASASRSDAPEEAPPPVAPQVDQPQDSEIPQANVSLEAPSTEQAQQEIVAGEKADEPEQSVSDAMQEDPVSEPTEPNLTEDRAIDPDETDQDRATEPDRTDVNPHTSPSSPHKETPSTHLDGSPSRKRSIVSNTGDSEPKRSRVNSIVSDSIDATFLMCRDRCGFKDASARRWFCSESRSIQNVECQHMGDQERARIFKFWLAVRAGRMPLASLPRFNDMFGFIEARAFLDQHREVDAFWEQLNADQLQPGMVPPKLEHAVEAARKQGAEHFFPSGTYTAPSEHLQAVGVSEMGLYSLCLRFPNEVVANWSGTWLWKDNEKSTEEAKQFFPEADKPSIPVEGFPNYGVLKRYALLFRPPKISDSEKYAEALVDPSRGASEVTVNALAQEEECCCLMNEPRPGHMANCLSISIVYDTETKMDRRYQLLIVTGIPVLPGEELLLHYGSGYERDYEVGQPCTEIFEKMPLRATFSEK